jgi:hypothetical protein
VSLSPDFEFFLPSIATHFSVPKMVLMNTVKHSNGEILTGRLWRKSHTFFDNLPFYSNIPRIDEMAATLEQGLGEGGFQTLLIVSSPLITLTD